MRTTIEITDQQRARLLALAASKGQKGFSGLVQEAIDLYLEHLEEAKRDALVLRSLGAIGSLDEQEEVALRREVTRVRGTWR